jgi:hypothetical protein
MNARLCYAVGRLAAASSAVISVILLPGFSQAQPAPLVLSTLPGQNGLNVPVFTNIPVTFDVDMDENTLNGSTFSVSAWSTELHSGTISYDGPSKTATFDPEAPVWPEMS